MNRAGAVVVGAGVAGLAAAVRLQAAGVQTVLLDRNPTPGGKLNILKEKDYTFDTGPSLVTMPEVFEELFAAAGMSLREEIALRKLDPYCRYFFADGSELETSDSIERMSRDLLRIAPRDVESFFAFLAKAAMWYRMSAEAVIAGPPLDWKNMSRSSIEPVEFFRARPFQKLEALIHTTFHEERIRRIARLIALYTGCHPRRTAAIFSLIPFLEFGLGRWYIEGGLYTLAEKLIQRFRALGGTFISSCTVRRIEFRNGRAARAHTASGDAVEGEWFVVNADVATAARTILAEAPGARRLSRRLEQLRPSTSAFVLLIGARLLQTRLIHHNILFSADEQREWRELFEEERPPSQPTIYLNNPSFTDPSVSPPGGSALFAMVNVPARLDWDWDAYQQLVLNRIESFLGAPLQIETMHRRTPADFAERTFADRGSLYGKAPDSLLAMMRRPKNEEPGFAGVLFAGGTTHPGAGIPLAALSGKLVASRILQKGV